MASKHSLNLFAPETRAEQPVRCELHCAGCPATRNGILLDLIGASSEECPFESLTVESREAIPIRWFDRYRIGIVRRGVLLRQRADAHGRATAIDIVGPGCAFPIEPRLTGQGDGTMSVGYAVTRALICLSEEPPIRSALEKGGASVVDLHRLQCEALYRMERLADARGRATAASRVAALLCALTDTLVRHAGDGERIPGGILQRDLAALLSIRHESVCRILRDFAKHGVVSHGSDGIEILDRAALERFGGEEPARAQN